MTQERSNLKGVVFALTGFAIFATHDAIVKFLGGDYSSFQILFFSVLFGFPLGTLMLLHDRMEGNLRPVHPWWVAARTVAAMFSGLAAFYAFTKLPLAQVYAFIFASPLLVTILSIPILGERVGMHRWVAVVVGLTGVLVVLRPGGTDMTLGHFAGLFAALGSAFGAVITRKIGNEERSAVLMLYPMVANCVLMGAALPFVYVPMPVQDLGLVAVLSLFGFVGGLFMINAFRLADAAIIAPMHYSQIIWGAGFGFLFFSEVPDRYTWVGVAIIISAGFYVVIREMKRGNEMIPVLKARSRQETPTVPSLTAMLRARSDRARRSEDVLANRRKLH